MSSGLKPEDNPAEYNSTLAAWEYILAATIYRRDANYLLEHYDEGGENLFKSTYHFLISHAAELYMKAALLKRGIPLGRLKKSDARHNLTKLLSLIEEFGIPLSEQSRSVISALNENHVDHKLRYRRFNTRLNLPPPNIIEPALDELLGFCRISTHGR